MSSDGKEMLTGQGSKDNLRSYSMRRDGANQMKRIKKAPDRSPLDVLRDANISNRTLSKHSLLSFLRERRRYNRTKETRTSLLTFVRRDPSEIP
jgi:hypothetical protein